jgi:hypothetical protein
MWLLLELNQEQDHTHPCRYILLEQAIYFCNFSLQKLLIWVINKHGFENIYIRPTFYSCGDLQLGERQLQKQES